MIHYLFGISVLTPIKIAWVALTCVNIVLMLWLAWRGATPTFFGAYMVMMGACATLQGSPAWNPILEAILAIWTIPWIWSMMPKDRYGRVFVLAIGTLISAVLMYALPPPWPNYDPMMYFVRLYSAAVFMGVAFATCLLNRFNYSAMVAVPWFGSVLLASSQRGWDRWIIAISTNLIWTACLICWLAILRQDDAQGILGGDPVRASVLPVPDPHE
jgi:hypothetical protein